ncbi:MAG: hypothetical protein AAGC67_09885 [Myxococcota bacterium]
MIDPSASKRPRSGHAARVTRGSSTLVALVTIVASAVVAGIASPAHAESDVDPERRWAPAVAFQVDVLGNTGKAFTDGTDIVGPRAANAGPRFFDVPGTVVLESARSRQQLTTALIGGDFELMTPRLASSLNAPRLFVNVNVAAATGPEVGLARDGNPGNLAIPPGITDSSSAFVGEEAISGRGVKTTVQFQGPQVHAGFGAAFLVEASGHRFRVKPSFVYSRLPVDVYGVLKRAVRLNNNVGAARTYDNTYRSIELSAKQREVYHAAGAALEIEYETGDRIGPVAWSVFLKGQGSMIFGDLETNLTERNPDFPDEQVFFTYKHDRWFYRIGTGIRIRFDGVDVGGGTNRR